MSLRSYPGLMAAAASVLIFRAADGDTGASAPAPQPLDTIAKFTFPNLEGERSFDCTGIPADVRLDFLKSGVRNYIANRLNGVHTRHGKDEAVIAWAAYDAAIKADALQSAVPQPTVARPAEPDYAAAYTAAIEALTSGKVRKTGEATPRVQKDPLVKLVTDVVVRDVYNSGRATNPKYSFFDAKKDVGPDGMEYLNKAIAAKVAVDPALAAPLAKMLEEKYLKPARAMLGLTASKAVNDLPSIL